MLSSKQNTRVVVGTVTACLLSSVLLLTGCSKESASNAPETFTMPYEVDASPYGSLKAMTDASTFVFEGRIIGTNSDAVERQPKSSEEGIGEGESPDVFGTVTFEVISVLKGDPSVKEAALLYPSAKMQGKDKILYTHEGLTDVQSSSGELKKPDALKQNTYVVFAVKNDVYPVKPEAYLRAHPNSLARVLPNGKLQFGSDKATLQPVQRADQLTIEQLRATVKS